jgi:hypothetical protein
LALASRLKAERLIGTLCIAIVFKDPKEKIGDANQTMLLR